MSHFDVSSNGSDTEQITKKQAFGFGFGFGSHQCWEVVFESADGAHTICEGCHDLIQPNLLKPQESNSKHRVESCPWEYLCAAAVVDRELHGGESYCREKLTGTTLLIDISNVNAGNLTSPEEDNQPNLLIGRAWPSSLLLAKCDPGKTAMAASDTHQRWWRDAASHFCEGPTRGRKSQSWMFDHSTEIERFPFAGFLCHFSHLVFRGRFRSQFLHKKEEKKHSPLDMVLNRMSFRDHRRLIAAERG